MSSVNSVISSNAGLSKACFVLHLMISKFLVWDVSGTSVSVQEGAHWRAKLVATINSVSVQHPLEHQLFLFLSLNLISNYIIFFLGPLFYRYQPFQVHLRIFIVLIMEIRLRRRIFPCWSLHGFESWRWLGQFSGGRFANGSQLGSSGFGETFRTVVLHCAMDFLVIFVRSFFSVGKILIWFK